MFDRIRILRRRKDYRRRGEFRARGFASIGIGQVEVRFKNVLIAVPSIATSKPMFRRRKIPAMKAKSRLQIYFLKA
jgi:hypothetical protein